MGVIKVMMAAFLMLTLTFSILFVIRFGMEKFIDLLFGKEKKQ
jgi:hypothetical protein